MNEQNNEQKVEYNRGNEEKISTKNLKVLLIILALLGAGALYYFVFYVLEDTGTKELSPAIAEERKDQILNKRDATAKVIEFIQNTDTGEEILKVSVLVIDNSVDESKLVSFNFKDSEGAISSSSLILPMVWKDYSLRIDKDIAIEDGSRDDLSQGTYIRVVTENPLLSGNIQDALSVRILRQ